MSFLRNNLFLIMLVLATAVVSFALLAWGFSVSDQIDEEEMAPRTKLANNIKALSRKPYVNVETNNSDRLLVEDIERSLKGVIDQNVAWNSRDFKVPQLRTLKGEVVPALPYDSKTWQENGLPDQFVVQYHKLLGQMLTKLNATEPPLQSEIDAEAQLQEDTIQYRERIRRKNDPDAADAKTAAAGRAVAQPAFGGGKTSANISNEAMEIAIDNMKLRKARAGNIYASANSFQVLFPQGVMVSELEPEKIWEAQIGLWVQTDIVDVIGRTIKDVMDKRGLAEKDRSVLNSPIRRLENIEIVGQFAAAPKKEDKKAGGFGGMPGGMMPGGMMPGGMMPGGMMPGMMPGRQKKQSKKSSKKSDRDDRELPNTLTQRNDNKMLNVVNYKFTILMPARYLPVLERNLLKQNYHIILNEEVTPLAAGPAMAGNKAVAAEDESLYYYGTEPICRVTITGQLYLLADWIRGSWDYEEKKWTLLPLMPVSVIEALPKAALRKVDDDLIQQAENLSSGRKLDPKKPSLPWNSSAKTAVSGNNR